MNSAPTSASLLALLREVEARPGMFLAGEDSDRGSQPDSLEMLIRGYLIAVSQHQLADPRVALYQRFPTHLSKRFEWSLSQGPLRAIRHQSASDAEAWDVFWRLFWEFEQQRRVPG